MRAVLFDGQLRLVHTYADPALRPGEALIRPTLVGICNTDIEITRGYKGFHGVLGHEFVGTVVACEDAEWVGQRVVGEINAACGQCSVCRSGATRHCPERTALGIWGRDGVMADLFSLPVGCLHRVPASLPDEAAVFTEPLAAALEILEQVQLRPGARVAVVGDGKLGLLCAQVLRLPGCAVTLAGRHPERWALLAQHGVAACSVERAEPGFDLVVDCTGRAEGFAAACRLVRPRGILVLKSTFAQGASINLSDLVVNEVTLIGSRCGPFEPALRLLERGLISTQPLVAARYALADALAAFRAAPGRLKILLEV